MSASTEPRGGLTLQAVQQLSSETLAAIFLSDLEYEVAQNRRSELWMYGVDKCPSSPLTLSSVCRKWRQVALQTSGLWAVVRYGYQHGHKRWDSVQRVRLWLQRSEGAQLDLRLTCGERAYVKGRLGYDTLVVEEKGNIGFVHEILRGELHRCRTLRLCITEFNLVAAVFAIAKSNPSSTVLHVYLSGDKASQNHPDPSEWHPEPEFFPRDALDGAWPALVGLHLCFVRMELPVGILRGLRYLSFEGITPTQFCTKDCAFALRACPDLEELHFNSMWGVYDTGYESDEEEPKDCALASWEDGKQEHEGDRLPNGLTAIRLPKLTALTLYAVPMGFAQRLCARLVAPQLRNLTAACFIPGLTETRNPAQFSMVYGIIDLADLAHVESFRWEDDKSAFYDDGDGTDLPDIQRLLSRLQSVRVLDVRGCGLPSDMFVETLLKGTEDGTLCPKLEVLKVNDVPSELMKLLEARQASLVTSAIRQLHISGEPELDELNEIWSMVDEVVIDD